LHGMGHNIAPDPPPAAAWRAGDADGYRHYADAVWDPRVTNDLVRHFTVAFLERTEADAASSEGWPGAWNPPASLRHAIHIRTGQADAASPPLE